MVVIFLKHQPRIIFIFHVMQSSSNVQTVYKKICVVVFFKTCQSMTTISKKVPLKFSDMGNEKKLFSLEQVYHPDPPIDFCFQPGPANYISTFDKKQCYIWNKNSGDSIDQLASSPSAVSSVSWSPNGSYLLIAHEKHLNLWSSDKKHFLKTVTLSIKNESISAASFLHDYKTIILGTDKGSIIFYSLSSKKQQVVLSDHNSKILSIDVSGTVVSEKGKITIYDTDMEVLNSYDCGFRVDFIQIKSYPSHKIPMTAVYLTSESKAYLKIFTRNEVNECALSPLPVAIAFHSTPKIVTAYKGGKIAAFDFSKGTLKSERVFGPFREHKTQITSISLSNNELASSGDSGIRIRQLDDIDRLDTSIEPDTLSATFVKIKYSPDGSVLTALDSKNSINSYLCQVPSLTAATEINTCYLSGIKDLVCTRLDKKFQINDQVQALDCTDTGLIALAYQFQNSKLKFLTANSEFIQNYGSPITKFMISSSNTAVLIGTTLVVHKHTKMKLNELEGDQLRKFDDVIDFHLMEDFIVLIVADQQTNEVQYIETDEYSQAMTFKPPSKALKVFSGRNTVFSLILLSDSLILYNPLQDQVHRKIEKAPRNIKSVIWNDETDRFLIETQTGDWFMYTILRDALNKANENSVIFLFKVDGFSSKYQPLYFKNIDDIRCLEKRSNSIDSCNLLKETELKERDIFTHFCALREFDSALKIVLKKSDAKTKEKMIYLLAWNALEAMDFTFAKKCYSLVQDSGRVSACRDALKEQRWAAAAGKAAMLRSDADLANQLFENSGRANLAVELSAALGRYDRAVAIAEKHTELSFMIPELSLQSAVQAEKSGNYQEALARYQEAHKTMSSIKNSDFNFEHFRNLIVSGTAKCYIGLGSYSKGVRLTGKVDNERMKIEIAEMTKSKLECEGKDFRDSNIWLDIGVVFESVEESLVKIVFKYMAEDIFDNRELESAFLELSFEPKIKAKQVVDKMRSLSLNVTENESQAADLNKIKNGQILSVHDLNLNGQYIFKVRLTGMKR